MQDPVCEACGTADLSHRREMVKRRWATVQRGPIPKVRPLHLCEVCRHAQVGAIREMRNLGPLPGHGTPPFEA